MTAEEFLINKFKEIYQRRPDTLKARLSEEAYIRLNVTGRVDGREESYAEMMIEFAKYHVEKALEAVYTADIDNVVVISVNPWKPSDSIDPDKVKNLYPLSNIK